VEVIVSPPVGVNVTFSFSASFFLRFSAFLAFFDSFSLKVTGPAVSTDAVWGWIAGLAAARLPPPLADEIPSVPAPGAKTESDLLPIGKVVSGADGLISKVISHASRRYCFSPNSPRLEAAEQNARGWLSRPNEVTEALGKQRSPEVPVEHLPSW